MITQNDSVCIEKEVQKDLNNEGHSINELYFWQDNC